MSDLSATGPAAVFLPGLAGHAAEFDALARYWTSGPTLRLDPASGDDLSIAGQASQVAARAADAGFSRFVVVGHSQGGLVGLELAVSRPDLVAGVAVLDSPILLPRPLRAALRLLAALIGTRFGPPLLRAFFRATFAAADSAAHRRAVLERLASVPHPVAHRIVAAAFGYDGAAALGAVRVPVTCIKATIPVRLDRLPAGARGCTISAAGHWIHVHRAREVGRELEFLAAAVTASDLARPAAGRARRRHREAPGPVTTGISGRRPVPPRSAAPTGVSSPRTYRGRTSAWSRPACHRPAR